MSAETKKEVKLKLNEKVKVLVGDVVKTGFIAELHQNRGNGAWMPVHGVRVTTAPFNKGEFLAYRDPEDLQVA